MAAAVYTGLDLIVGWHERRRLDIVNHIFVQNVFNKSSFISGGRAPGRDDVVANIFYHWQQEVGENTIHVVSLQIQSKPREVIE